MIDLDLKTKKLVELTKIGVINYLSIGGEIKYKWAITDEELKELYKVLKEKYEKGGKNG